MFLSAIASLNLIKGCSMSLSRRHAPDVTPAIADLSHMQKTSPNPTLAERVSLPILAHTKRWCHLIRLIRKISLAASVCH